MSDLPQPADRRQLRVSDADREQAAEVLRQAAGDGRITFDELDQAPHWWQMPEGSPISPRFGWWELPAGGPIEPLAQTVIEAIRELALPAIQRELARPLDARWAPEPS